MDHSAPIEQRITNFDGIYKLSDEEYRSTPTIEMVFTTPLINSEFVNQDKHFQFLRRGFLDGERPASSQMNTDDDSSTSNDRQRSDDMQGLELTAPIFRLNLKLHRKENFQDSYSLSKWAKE